MNIKRLMGSPPGRLWAKMNEDNAFTWAVVLAWNFLVSLFPIVLVMAAVLGLALGFMGVGSGQIYHTVASFIPDPKAQQDTFNALNSFHQKSGLFFLIGFLGLVWSGTGLFRADGSPREAADVWRQAQLDRRALAPVPSDFPAPDVEMRDRYPEEAAQESFEAFTR